MQDSPYTQSKALEDFKFDLKSDLAIEILNIT